MTEFPEPELRKCEIYNDLLDEVNRVLIVAGDWNARPGPVATATRHILRKFAVDTRCANGDSLVNFAFSNRLMVSSARFQHPQRHLVENDGRSRNQIDHMLVWSRWASSAIDCLA